MVTASCEEVGAIVETEIRPMIRSLRGLFTSYDSQDNKQKPLAIRVKDGKTEVEKAEALIKKFRVLISELEASCDEALEHMESFISARSGTN